MVNQLQRFPADPELPSFSLNERLLNHESVILGKNKTNYACLQRG